MEALSRYPDVSFKPAWLDSFSHTPNLWPTTALLDWSAIHERMGERIASPPVREARLQEAKSILRSRVNFSGTAMSFSTERTDAWWWLMWNGDVNANRLLLAANDDPAWKDDIGRLVRGTLSRQNKGRWHTTVANAWGTLAMRKYSEKHEATPVTGRTTAELGGRTFATDWKQSEAAGLLPWGARPAALKLAGVVIDAIRCCKLALNSGISGALFGPSSYFMKSPPIQYSDEDARIRTETFIAGQNQEEPVSMPRLHPVKVKG